MIIISNQIIRGLGIKPSTCVAWVKNSFALKSVSLLPVKVAVKPSLEEFFTSMPCLLPPPDIEQETGLKRHYYGLKVVHRLEKSTPSLDGDILLYDAKTGELLALMDAEWITAMRTGAVAAAAARVLRKSTAKNYAFLGLGNTARATLLCLLEEEPEINFYVNLKRYKGQEELFTERFKDYKNVSFDYVENISDLVSRTDVLFSCVTYADCNIVEDVKYFKSGITVIPVHTRGFMNCDTVFDRVLGDDTAHVSGFRYFKEFHDYNEIGEVFAGRDSGRKSDKQRIINYNNGIGLHDVYFASKIYEMIEDAGLSGIERQKETIKFWV